MLTDASFHFPIILRDATLTPIDDEFAHAFIAGVGGVHLQILLNSYERLLGRSLIARSGNADQDANALYTAPFAVLSHGIEPDPIINFANQVALTLWQTTFKALTAMPSRLTAEPVLREAREKLLAEVAQHGFISGYEGVRISSTGRRFLIKNVTVWNLADAQGRPAGQAAAFDTWHDLASNSATS